MAKLTRKQYEARVREEIDMRTADRADREELEHVTRACRWLARAEALYGRRRVEALVRAHTDAVTARVWLGYWRRWKAGEARHLVPRAVLLDAWGPADMVAFNIALRPRIAA